MQVGKRYVKRQIKQVDRQVNTLVNREQVGKYIFKFNFMLAFKVKPFYWFIPNNMFFFNVVCVFSMFQMHLFIQFTRLKWRTKNMGYILQLQHSHKLIWNYIKKSHIYISQCCKLYKYMCTIIFLKKVSTCTKCMILQNGLHVDEILIF